MLSSISNSGKLLFTKHLSTMIKSGIPIAEALSSLASYAGTPNFRKILESIVANIENGKTLAQSLKQHPKVFNNLFVSLIEIGEESGTWEESLEFLSLQLAKDYALKKKIQGALMYPMLVFLTTFGMGGFIALFILPKLVDFFSAFDIELPLATKILLFIAQFMKNYGLFSILFLAILFVILILISKIPKVKPFYHALLLKIPFIGKLISYGQLAQFSRNLGILLKSGVPINHSLEVIANVLSNLKYQEDVKNIARNLLKGKNISSLLSKKNSRFPPLISEMVSVGEKTGKLDESLLYVSAFYEEEIDSYVKNLTTLLEPVLLIIVGLTVGFIALAIISPIYELTGSIRK